MINIIQVTSFYGSDISDSFRKLGIYGNDPFYCTKGKYGKIFYNLIAVNSLYDYIDKQIKRWKRRVVIFSLSLQNIEIVRKFKVKSFIVNAILNDAKIVKEVLTDKIVTLNEENEKLETEYAQNITLRNIINNLSFSERLKYLFTKKIKKLDTEEISPELEKINERLNSLSKYSILNNFGKFKI